ncbi:MAG TPA: NAD(P) transhydrogenase subunit alpha [Acidimicrobiia bacterium]
MHIGIPRPDHTDRRVGLVPSTVASLVGAGHRVTVEIGAGLGSGYGDELYRDVGAELGDPYGSDFLAVVTLPPIDRLDGAGALMGLISPFDRPDLMGRLAATGITSFAFEAVPRTTRAQSMDALSSQATAAGYQAALEAARLCDRFFPMLTTAAGTIRPATVVVLGAGVAGLQAVATVRRLGAVVWAFDVRSAAAEQVKSLGARFIAVDTPAQDASASGGYAKEVARDDQERIHAAIGPHIAKADAVICTAAIPGRPAPLLVTEEMVDSMRPGAVIVDLAAATGGNCALTEPGSTVEVGGVTIVGDLDLVSRTAAHASEMYSHNMRAFLDLVVDDDGGFAPDWDDEIVAESCITRDGRVVHSRLVEEEN